MYGKYIVEDTGTAKSQRLPPESGGSEEIIEIRGRRSFNLHQMGHTKEFTRGK